MESIPDIDVFVGNITYIDFTVYDLWLEHTGAEAARDRLMTLTSNDDEEDDKLMFYNYVLDQFRIFGMLEPMLHNPTMLSSQMTYQIAAESQKKLISKYYALDGVVVREILGKKLNKSTRRDLDEISVKTQRELRCCQRQFDNCRRVSKAVEDLPGNLIEIIQKQFLLPLSVSWDFAAVVFLANHRFECCKRKLNCLTLKDFVECSNFMMQTWTCGTTDAATEIDREFLHELRGVKILISDQKLFDLHKVKTSQKTKGSLISLQKQGVSDKSTENERFEASFRHLSRAIVGIASNLYKTKEIRDFFVDIFEKIIEPCRSWGWDQQKLNVFFQNYDAAANDLSQMQQFTVSWKKYITTTTKCVLQFYHL